MLANASISSWVISFRNHPAIDHSQIHNMITPSIFSTELTNNSLPVNLPTQVEHLALVFRNTENRTHF